MKKLITLLLASSFIASTGYAQTAAPTTPATPAPAQPTLPHYSPILPVKIHPRQDGADSMSKAAADIQQDNKVDPDSLGLLKIASEGALNENLWKNYSDEQLSQELSKINLNISSTVLRAIFIRALLTQPAPTTDKSKSEAFSARLQTLIDLGDYDDVFKLYKKLEGNIPSDKAALAGVEAMIGKGQMGLACLEEKALTDDLKTTQGNSFWPDLKNFCGILLTATPTVADDKGDALIKTVAASPAIAQKFPAITTLEELNARSLIAVFALDRGMRIPASLYTFAAAQKLKPSVIALLLKNTELLPATKLFLTAAAVDKGILAPADLTALYQTYSAMPTGTGEWEPLLTAYAKIQAALSDKDKSDLIKSALSLRTDGNIALLPFARQAAAMKSATAFNAAQARSIVAMLIKSKIAVSGVWAAQAFNTPALSTKESVTDIELLTALNSSNSPQTIPADALQAAKESKELKVDKKQQTKPQIFENPYFYALSLILGSQETEDKINEKSYEKLFSLTGINDYVMPTKELMNGLQTASSAQDVGKTVLYSLQILNGQRVSQLHPAAYLRISEGLKSVGLSEEIRSLAHEVLADLIDRK